MISVFLNIDAHNSGVLTNKGLLQYSSKERHTTLEEACPLLADD